MRERNKRLVVGKVANLLTEVKYELNSLVPSLVDLFVAELLHLNSFNDFDSFLGLFLFSAM